MDDNIKSSSKSVMKMAMEGYLEDERKGPTHGKSKDKDVIANEDLYQRFSKKRHNWDTNAEKCEKFRAGYQWTKAQIDELTRKKKAPIVVNLINPAVEQLKSLLTMNAPKYNALPREGSDRKTATAMGDLMSYVWQINRGNVKLKDAVDDYSVKGLGYLMAYWDPYKDFGKGEIIIEDIDPFNVYVDPLSRKRDFSDARHILVVHDWTKEQIKSYFHSMKESFFKSINPVMPRDHDGDIPSEITLESETDSEPDYYRVIDRYSKRRITMCHFQMGDFEYVIEESIAENYLNKTIFHQTTTVLENGQKEEFYAIDDDEIKTILGEIDELGTEYTLVMEMDEQTGEPEIVPVPGPPVHENSVAVVHTTKLKIQNIVDKGILKKTDYTDYYVHRCLTVGEKLYWKGYTGIKDYQIVPLCNRHKRNPYPSSDVFASMNLQKELNVTRMHIMTHTANVASLKVAMPKGSGKVSDMEEKLGQAGIAVVEYNAEEGGSPHFMFPPAMPNQLYESEQRFENTIYEQFGVYPFMGGGGGGGGHSTSSGMLIMDDLAQRRIASKRTDIEESLNCLGRVVIQLIQRHYTEAKTVRLLQPSGRYNEIDINSPVYEQFSERLLHRINDVTIGAYDIIVASGSTLPTNRMIRMEYFMKLYAQNLIDQYEVLKNVDEVDAEGVMERMGLLNQLQGQVEALSEEVKKLEGDLQTADREAVGARKRVEVEKFKAQLAKMGASIDKALNATKEREITKMRTQGVSDASMIPDDSDQNLVQTINQLG